MCGWALAGGDRGCVDVAAERADEDVGLLWV